MPTSVDLTVPITLKDIVQLLFMVAALFGSYYAIKIRLTILEQMHGLRLDYIDASVEDMRITMKTQGKQDAEIVQLRREIDQNRIDINELRHWKGFVKPDGEYRRDQTPTIPV